MPGHVLSHKISAVAWGDLDSRLIHGSLGSLESKSQTASRLVQPFFSQLTADKSVYFTMGSTFSPQNCPFHAVESNTWLLLPDFHSLLIGVLLYDYSVW